MAMHLRPEARACWSDGEIGKAGPQLCDRLMRERHVFMRGRHVLTLDKKTSVRDRSSLTILQQTFEIVEVRANQCHILIVLLV